MSSYPEHPFIFSVGVNHRSSPLEVREKLSINNEELPAALDIFKGMLRECLILSTCNRTEIYCVSDTSDFDRNVVKKKIIEFKNASDVVNTDHFFDYATCGTVNHIFKVATSIDSMVVGDVQIMHQLKEAYLIAKGNKSTGKFLNILGQKALHTGKRARHETVLYEGSFSVSYAAVELAMKIFGNLGKKSVMLIGAGETAELTAKNLIRKDVNKLLVTNRTRQNAEKMVESLKQIHDFQSEIIDFDNFKNKIHEADIIITSTGSKDYILTYPEFKNLVSKRKGLPMLIIDIAIPRDIDPMISNVDNVFLKNIDDLEDIVNADYEKRMKVIPEVESIINSELIDYLVWYYSIPILPAIHHILKVSENGMIAKKKIIRLRENLAEDIVNIHRNFIKSENLHSKEEIQNHFQIMDKISRINQEVLVHQNETKN